MLQCCCCARPSCVAHLFFADINPSLHIVNPSFSATILATVSSLLSSSQWLALMAPDDRAPTKDEANATEYDTATEEIDVDDLQRQKVPDVVPGFGNPWRNGWGRHVFHAKTWSSPAPTSRTKSPLSSTAPAPASPSSNSTQPLLYSGEATRSGGPSPAKEADVSWKRTSRNNVDKKSLSRRSSLGLSLPNSPPRLFSLMSIAGTPQDPRFDRAGRRLLRPASPSAMLTLRLGGQSLQLGSILIVKKAETELEEFSQKPATKAAYRRL